jgi:hypothetical protein
MQGMNSCKKKMRNFKSNPKVVRGRILEELSKKGLHIN